MPALNASVSGLVLDSAIGPSNYGPLSTDMIMGLPMLKHVGLVMRDGPKGRAPSIRCAFGSMKLGRGVPMLKLCPGCGGRVALVCASLRKGRHTQSGLGLRAGALRDEELPGRVEIMGTRCSQVRPNVGLMGSPKRSRASASVPCVVSTSKRVH